jgi:hypothetical protein
VHESEASLSFEQAIRSRLLSETTSLSIDELARLHHAARVGLHSVTMLHSTLPTTVVQGHAIRVRHLAVSVRFAVHELTLVPLARGGEAHEARAGLLARHPVFAGDCVAREVEQRALAVGEVGGIDLTDVVAPFGMREDQVGFLGCA